MGPRVCCQQSSDRADASHDARRNESCGDHGGSAAGRYGRDGQGGPPAEDEPRRVWCWDSPFPLVDEGWMTVTSQAADPTISLGTAPSAPPAVAPRPRLPTTMRVARFRPANFSTASA